MRLLEILMKEVELMSKILYLLKGKITVFIRAYCEHFNKPIKYSCSNVECTLGIKIPFSNKAVFIQRRR